MPQCHACERSETATEALSARGVRLTELRREVLQHLYHADKPVGAYEMFDRLKEEGKASAPPAVYRVLDFLVEQGLAHKLQTISAYTACTSKPHPHTAMFTICQACGDVQEREVAPSAALDQARGEFKVENLMIEAIGLCAACQ